MPYIWYTFYIAFYIAIHSNTLRKKTRGHKQMAA